MSLTPGEARKKHRQAFMAFWTAYPRKIAPAEAENVFASMIESRGLDPVHLINAARAYAARCGEDLTYVPSAHAWLKQGRYDDADLFTDERQGQIAWLKQMWQTANVKSVQDRYHITMEKVYPPEDIKPEDIPFWYKQICRAWITSIYKEKLEQCPTTSSPPTTNGQSRLLSEQSSSSQVSLEI